MDILNILQKLTDIMSITGFEFQAEKVLKEHLMRYFDSYHQTPLGSHIFIKKCSQAIEHVPTIVLNAHFDEIGLLVTDITEDGFLRVTNIGKIDSRIMPAARVQIFGKQLLHGIIVSTPPHLQKMGDSQNLVSIPDLLVDTGYTKRELESMVSIGTPIGFLPNIIPLANSRYSGKGFDNRAGIVAALRTIELLSQENCGGMDLVLQLSSYGEVAGIGAGTALFDQNPMIVFTIDACMADTSGIPEYKTATLGEGPTILRSMVTTRHLTNAVIDYANEKHLSHQVLASPKSVGIDGDIIPLVCKGIPTVAIGIPLNNIHTATETISLDDIESTAVLLSGFIKDEIPNWRVSTCQ